MQSEKLFREVSIPHKETCDSQTRAILTMEIILRVSKQVPNTSRDPVCLTRTFTLHRKPDTVLIGKYSDNTPYNPPVTTTHRRRVE